MLSTTASEAADTLNARQRISASRSDLRAKLLLCTSTAFSQRVRGSVQSAAALLTIINDILDFSKIESGKMTLEQVPFDVCELFESTTRILAVRAAQKGGERFEMIKNSLDTQKIDPHKYCILPIRNINNYALWCQHVRLLTPPFQTVYTGSPLVKKLFAEEKIYQIKDVKKEINVCATDIRISILNKNEWEKFVPKEVAKFIEKIDGLKRIQAITESIPFA